MRYNKGEDRVFLEAGVKIIVCLDERGGMAFNKRRQSRDALVSADILATAGGRLTVYPYSERLMSEAVAAGAEHGFRVSERALEEADAEDFVFVEDRAIGKYAKAIDGLIIYHWNRHYPADLRLDVTAEGLGMKLCSSCEFVGHAHEKITKEIYGK